MAAAAEPSVDPSSFAATGVSQVTLSSNIGTETSGQIVNVTPATTGPYGITTGPADAGSSAEASSAAGHGLVLLEAQCKK